MAIVFPASPSVNDTFTEGSITYKWDGAKWIGLGVTPADRLVEGSNKLEIDASNNLVWTGDNIGIGTDNPQRKLHTLGTQTNTARFENTSTNDAIIEYKGTTGTSYAGHSNNDFVIGPSSTEKLRITSGGQLQATGAADVRLTLGSGGTAGTNNSVHMRADGANLLFMNASGGLTKFESNGTETLSISSGGEVQITNSGSSNGSTVQQLSLYTDNSGNGDNFTQRIAYTRANDTSKVFAAIDSVRTGTFNTDLVFSNDDGGVLGEKLRLISTGNVSIANGDLVVASGHGIDFSATGDATGMTNELLDDYEEGTWTPTYFGASTAGSYSLISTEAKYTKIGNTVHLYVDMKNITQSSAGTGLLRIGGLPFTPSNGNEAGSVILEAFSFPSTVEYAVLRTSTLNHLALVGVRNSGVDIQFNVADRDSDTSDIFGQITYMTSA